jgi:hypothetical protein
MKMATATATTSLIAAATTASAGEVNYFSHANDILHYFQFSCLSTKSY